MDFRVSESALLATSGENLAGMPKQWPAARGVKMWYDEVKHTRNGRVWGEIQCL